MFPRITFTLLLTCCAAHAAALSLGPIESRSALYGKFAATIAVNERYPGEADDLEVGLASPEDFERMGVERLFFLSQLQFDVSRQGTKTLINIRSRRPITEPYMDFVVEVVWREGRMLREYTVLLDPPGLESPAPAVNTAPEHRTAPAAVPASAPTAASRVTGNRWGPTQRNDTLWSIAAKTRADRDITVQQQMLAIKALNPGAFIDNNINLLKQGETLQIPTAEEVQRHSPSAAARAVRQDEDNWQAKRSAPALPEQEQPLGRLRILRPTEDAANGSGTILDEQSNAGTAANNGRPSALTRKVNTLETAAERRIEQMREQFAAQGAALAVKDQQIADLQQQVAAMQAEMERLLASKPTQVNRAEQPLLNLWWLFIALVAAVMAALVWMGTRTSPAASTS